MLRPVSRPIPSSSLTYLNEEFPTAVTQKFMKSHLHLKRRSFPLNVKILQVKEEQVRLKSCFWERLVQVLVIKSTLWMSFITLWLDLVFFFKERQFVLVRCVRYRQHISKRNILKSFSLSDIIICKRHTRTQTKTTLTIRVILSRNKQKNYEIN